MVFGITKVESTRIIADKTFQQMYELSNRAGASIVTTSGELWVPLVIPIERVAFQWLEILKSCSSLARRSAQLRCDLMQHTPCRNIGVLVLVGIAWSKIVRRREGHIGRRLQWTSEISEAPQDWPREATDVDLRGALD
eukprot:5308673-Amphidinium_carterae.2